MVNRSNLDFSRCGHTTWKKYYAESIAIKNDEFPGITDGT